MDPRLLRQQVMVATLPGASPEVHLVCVDQAQGSLSIREASVKASGEVNLGVDKGIKLSDVHTVQAKGNGSIAVLGKGGRVLAELLTESAEEEKLWADGLDFAVRNQAAALASKEAKDGSDKPRAVNDRPNNEERRSDMELLQAKSRQLQTRISSLEGLSEKRDRQLQAMVKRLEGAMQMLTAVQEMCQQQRRVIHAQRQAITDLREDLGDGDDNSATEQPAADGDAATAAVAAPVVHTNGHTTSPARPASTRAAAAAASPGSANRAEDGDREEEDEDEDDNDDDESVRKKMMQVVGLLQEADQLQKLLQQLQAGGHVDEASMQALSGLKSEAAATDSDASSPTPGPSPSTGYSGRHPQASGSSLQVLERLQALEAEKEHYKSILRASSQDMD